MLVYVLSPSQNQKPAHARVVSKPTASAKRKDDRGMNVLHLAARNGDARLVEHLLDQGADVGLKNDGGWTPLHFAAMTNEADSHLRVMRVLLERGADPHARSKHLVTPVHYLLQKSTPRASVLKLFLEFGASFNLRDDRREIPLFKFVRVNPPDPEETRPPREWQLRNFQPPRKKDHAERLVLRCSDVNALNADGRNVLQLSKQPYFWRAIVEHLALMQFLSRAVSSSLLETIENSSEFEEYFEACIEELILARNTTVGPWLSCLGLLVADKAALKNYATSLDRRTNYSLYFPIYGGIMQENVRKSFKRRLLFDKATEVLANCVPIFRTEHRVVRDVLECLDSKELYKFLRQDAFR